MIYLFTDFGWSGPYVGEMKAVLMQGEVQPNIVDLMHDAPAFNPRASAYLLAALSRRFIPGDLCLAVVDPGVGNIDRRAIMLEANNVCYIGPDNGLFSIIQRRSRLSHCREILWRPEQSSDTFHGRDLFAPVALSYFRGNVVDTRDIPVDFLVGTDFPEQLQEVIYVDHYGNAVTGIDANAISPSACLIITGQQIRRARTFSDVNQGQLFWHTNSMGLVEIAANCTSASDILGLKIGGRFEIE